MSEQNPWEEYTITPEQLKLKAFLDEHFKPTYEFPYYCIWCTIHFDLYCHGFRFALTEKDDEDCEDIFMLCKEYLREKKHKQKATTLAGTSPT